MKELVIISGKGGTGKTIFTGALAHLAKNKVMVDCDVDAANLYLLLDPEMKERQTFKGMATARINDGLCDECGLCEKLCRFDAVKNFSVDQVACEGCGFCALACPRKAIDMEKRQKGEYFVSDTKFGSFVHAKLGIAEDNSGKLVSLVRSKAGEIAKEKNSDWIIIDGPPGMGCPVVAAIGGTNCALIVTEPTESGLHDAQRVIETAGHFKIPVKMIINKYDLNSDMTKKIETYAAKNNISVVGKIKFDKKIVEAMSEGKSIMEYKNRETAITISSIWEKLSNEIIQNEKNE